jgi:hypothetical protein
LIGAPLDGKDAANSVMLKVMDQILRSITAGTSAVGDYHALVRTSHYGTMHHYRSEETVGIASSTAPL